MRGFGVPVALGRGPRRNSFDLLNLPRPRSARPWAYVKIAEGCDRACGFCAIPTFRGKQRSRSLEVASTSSTSRRPESSWSAGPRLVRSRSRCRREVDRAGWSSGRGSRRLGADSCTLYPSELNEQADRHHLRDGRPYFDSSLHTSRHRVAPHASWGNGERFLRRIGDIRRRERVRIRAKLIVRYPGETEADHDQLLRFLDEAQLEWCGSCVFRGAGHLRRGPRRHGRQGTRPRPAARARRAPRCDHRGRATR